MINVDEVPTRLLSKWNARGEFLQGSHLGVPSWWFRSLRLVKVNAVRHLRLVDASRI
jgi:hypothetical protein